MHGRSKNENHFQLEMFGKAVEDGAFLWMRVNFVTPKPPFPCVLWRFNELTV